MYGNGVYILHIAISTQCITHFMWVELSISLLHSFITENHQSPLFFIILNFIFFFHQFSYARRFASYIVSYMTTKRAYIQQILMSFLVFFIHLYSISSPVLGLYCLFAHIKCMCVVIIVWNTYMDMLRGSRRERLKTIDDFMVLFCCDLRTYERTEIKRFEATEK